VIADEVFKQLTPIVLGPLDRLVVVFPADSLSKAQLDEFKQAVDGLGFAGRVLFVAGVEELAVLRGEETPW
jgi:hypothetical protein